MDLDNDTAYRALQQHDARFDGRLFIGVTSTGVYCRPVCRVRIPMRRNCRFFANAPSAEASGFRPCMRCRPELAPGLSLVDSPQVLAQHAARMLDEAARGGQDVDPPAVAARLGVTDRHLRRIFATAHGVTPLDYLTTQRLLLAKRLLTDTPMPVADVAMAAGFGSVRRFNDVFAQRYRMNPRALRKAGSVPTPGAALTLRLAYRPPYDVSGVMRFLAARQLIGIESVAVQARQLRRTLALDHQGQRYMGWLSGQFAGGDAARHEFELQISTSLLPALGGVIERVRQGLDLDADPALIEPALLGLPGTAGTRLPNGFDGFESAVRVILGQQVSVAAARTLVTRLVDRFGEPLATPFTDLSRLFPTAHALAQTTPDSIGELGIVRQRVGALQALAREVHEGRIHLNRGAPITATQDALRALPGIGDWSVQLISMRALAWPDSFPATDIGVLNALEHRDPQRAQQQADAWRPWRSYAVMRLWQSLETGT